MKDHLHRDESPTELVMINDVAEPIFEQDNKNSTSVFSAAIFEEDETTTEESHYIDTLYYKDVPHKTKEELLKHKKDKDHEHDKEFGGDDDHGHPVLPSNIRRKIIRRGRKRLENKEKAEEKDASLRQFTRTPRTPVFELDDEEEEVKSVGTGRKILSADAANFGSLEEQQHHMMMMLRNAIAMVS